MMINKVVASLRKEYSRLEKEMGTSRESAGRSWSCRREEAQEDGPYLEQGCPPTHRRGTKTTLGESPKGRRQASQDVSNAFASTAAGLVRNFS